MQHPRRRNHLFSKRKKLAKATLEINGLWGGYIGTGFKTVIPAEAYAKISCRLVPGQDPKDIALLVSKAIQNVAPKGIKVETTVHEGGGPAVRVSAGSKIVQAAAKSYEEIFKKPCQYIFRRSFNPVVSELAKFSGGDTVLLGLGLSTDRIHAPNEHFGIDRIEKGFEIIVRMLQNLKN